jgi:hypothetical protein
MNERRWKMLKGWLKRLMFSRLSLSEIERQLQWWIRRKMFKVAIYASLLFLLIGVGLGYSWHRASQVEWNREVEAKVKKLQADLADKADRLADKEGKREAEKQKGVKGR